MGLFRLKNTIFAIFATLLPFLMLAAAEVLLRQTNTSQSAQVFIPVSSPAGHLILNPDYPRRYFRDFRPSVALHPFSAAKKPGTFRIFVLGGSTTAGYPHHFGYAFPAQLELLLKKHRPDTSFEVINLGMTAVNSYTVWHLNHHLAAFEPDLVLIYAGHNEYYGAMGAQSGSRIPPFLKRLGLRARDLALVQHAESWFSRRALPEPDPQPLRTTMQARVQNADIQLDGTVYQAGIEQFASNMRAIDRRNTRLGIPTMAGTVFSNLEHPPLDTDPDTRRLWQDGMQRVQDAAIDAGRAQLLLAKERDVIRFRAPEAINHTLRQRFHTRVVDLTDAPLQTLPGTGPFFTDHLHPGSAGYGIMAARFAAHILQTDISPVSVTPDPFETHIAAAHITLLKAAWPFATPADTSYAAAFEHLVATLASRPEPAAVRAAGYLQTGGNPAGIYRELMAAMPNATARELAASYLSLSHWLPGNPSVYAAALARLAETDYTLADAEALLLRAANQTDETFYYNVLAALYVGETQLPAARRFLEFVEAQEPDNPDLLYNFARYHLTTGDTLRARDYFTRYQFSVTP